MAIVYHSSWDPDRRVRAFATIRINVARRRLHFRDHRNEAGFGGCRAAHDLPECTYAEIRTPRTASISCRPERRTGRRCGVTREAGARSCCRSAAPSSRRDRMRGLAERRTRSDQQGNSDGETDSCRGPHAITFAPVLRRTRVAAAVSRSDYRRYFRTVRIDHAFELVRKRVRFQEYRRIFVRKVIVISLDQPAYAFRQMRCVFRATSCGVGITGCRESQTRAGNPTVSTTTLIPPVTMECRIRWAIVRLLTSSDRVRRYK